MKNLRNEIISLTVKYCGDKKKIHYAENYGTKVRVLPQSSLNNYSVNNILIKNGAEILCFEDFDTEAR